MRKSSTRRLLRSGSVAAALTLGLSLAACSGGAPDTGTGETTAPATGTVDPFAPEQSSIRLVQYQTPSAAPYFAALDNGYFDDYGIAIESVWGQSSAEMLTMVIGGDSDIGFNSFWSTVDANVGGAAEVVIIGELFRLPAGALTVEVLPDSDIQSMADFPGKTIGVVGLNGAQDNIIKYAMSLQGIDYSTVDFVHLPWGDMASQVEAGTIDAGVSTGAWVNTMRTALNTRPVFDYGEEFPGFPWGGWVTTRSFAEANPNTVAAFQCAQLVRGGALVDEDDDAFAQILADDLGLNEETIATELEFKYEFAGDIDVRLLQQIPDIQYAIGALAEEFDISSIIVPLPDHC